MIDKLGQEFKYCVRFKFSYSNRCIFCVLIRIVLCFVFLQIGNNIVDVKLENRLEIDECLEKLNIKWQEFVDVFKQKGIKLGDV